MRKIFDRGITITPKRGRIAGPSAKVRTAYCLSLMLLALQAIFTGSSVCVMQWTGVIRDGTLIEKGI